MKIANPQRIAALGLFCLILILACSKDFDAIVMDSFDFTLEGIHEENGFVFEPIRTDFKLETERAVSTVSYFMKYEVLRGKGYYLGNENDTIHENDSIRIKNLDLSYRYMPLDTGKHQVRISAWDSNRLQKELELFYHARHASFSFLLGKGTDNFIVNGKNPVNITLLRDKDTADPEGRPSEDFDISYRLENGSGTLIGGDKSYAPGVPFTLPKGVSELDYLPETLGEHKLTMTAKAPDGATLTKELLLLVENVEFTFRATAASSQVQLDTNLAINIDLRSQDGESGVTYDISHSFSPQSQGAGIVRDQNGGVMDPGTFRPIDLGNKNFTFQDDVLGQRKIYFDVRDSNGQLKRDSVEIEVANIPFSFTGNAQNNELFVNQRIQLNFNIKSEGNSPNIEYFLSYELEEGNGKVTAANGNTLQNNTDYPVDTGNFAMFYTPETLGQHRIRFLITDNYGQVVGPVEIDLEAKPLDLEFNASANENEVLVGQRGAISLSLIEQGDYSDVSYELNYFISGGGASLYNGNSPVVPSQYFSVDPGSFSFDFIGEFAGTYEITFLLLDSNGQILEDTVTVVVGNNDFTVDMTPSKATEFSNVPVGIILNIEETPKDTDDSYVAFFSSSQNGSMSINGIAYGPGERFALNAGSNTVSYTGTEPGQHNLVLSITSGSDVTRSTSATVTFEQVDFSFTGGSQKSDITVGETTGLNFNISESIGASEYSMRFAMSGNAIIKDNDGNELNPGNSYDVTTGNFNWSLEGTVESNVRMAFTVINHTGLEKTVDITVNVAPKDYTFTASGTVQQAYTDEQVDVNFNIAELGIGGDTYEMYFSTNGNNGTFEYGSNSFSAGESFSVPVGSFSGRYTGSSEGNHNITFTVRSSSGVGKTANININISVYEEPFTLNVSQSSQNKFIDEPFDITAIVNATSGHDPNVTYTMTFTFNGASAGALRYKGTDYTEGEPVPLDYGSSPMQFTPETDENFALNILVVNSTGQSQTTSETVEMLKRPKVAAKGEKHNINCGGLNGCDYQIRIHTCFASNCSEAYNGADLQQVEIRIYNRSARRWDTKLLNYSQARGTGVDRYFEIETEPSEGKLLYLDQNYEVRVRDSNGQWSEWVTGTVVRV